MSTNKVNSFFGAERKTIWPFRALIFFFILLIIYPIFFVILTSLKTSSDFYTNIWGLPKEYAWENYSYAWNTAEIGKCFYSSVIVVVITVIITLFIGALAGYALAKLRVPKADTIIVLIFLLTMLPSESVLMPTYLMTSKMKMTGTYAALVFPYIGWGLALTIYIYRNFFMTIPSELIEAARIDGCSESKAFWSVMFPLVLPATATNAIFLFMAWWGELLWASVELATANFKTLPLGITAFVQSFGTNWGPLSAASCIILIPIVLIFLFAQKYFMAGLTSGAVKG